MEYKEKIEKAFGENTPETEMTPEDFRILTTMLMDKDVNMKIDINEIDKNSKIYKHFEPIIKSFLAQVFLTRIEKLTTLKMSLGALIALMIYMENAADCVIYSLYLQHNLEENTVVTLEVFCEKLFRWGMFSREQLKNIWGILQTPDDKYKN